MNKLALLLAAGDFFLVVLAYYSGVFLRFGGQLPAWSGSIISFAQIVLLGGILILTSSVFELYSLHRSLSRANIVTRIVFSLGLAFVLLSSLFFMIPEIVLGRGVLLISMVMFGLCQYLWHSYSSFIFRIPGLNQRCLVVGVGDLACDIGEAIEEESNNYYLVGYIQPLGAEIKVDVDKIIGMVESLPESAVQERVGKIVVALNERRGVLPFQELLSCRFAGIEVVDAVTFYEEATGQLKIQDINPDWFIYSTGFGFGDIIRFCKRSLDIFFALIGIILTLPILPLIALAIKMESPGEVFFSQVRVGENGHDFKIYKFRSMRQDAEAVSGAVWAGEDDPRITRIGNFLRKTRLDEIPQLFNVFMGNMAFVGPRPERPEFISNLEKEIPYYSKRHALKPGVTGWAQVCYPYGASVEDSMMKLKYDLYYPENRIKRTLLSHYSQILQKQPVSGH
ncbi:MAG: TIGR03013 family XrtA/PEP-CTERM system glycosyltransferase [Pseudomonadota bacterium]|nr:TIGR03013 family XrtA/PEP-CTERM system glycosyltransferase [Pseudomonadota bacterium]